MPTFITHGVVGAAIAQLTPDDLLRKKTVLWFTGLAILPDIDVLASEFGIPYAHPLGHRGFTHSLLFALITSGLVCLFLRYQARVPVRSFARVWSVGFLAVASHGLLDSATNRGMGVGFLVPFMENRFSFPFRPIGAAPLSIARMLDSKILGIFWTELLWIWLPMAVVFGLAYLLRKTRTE